MEVAPTHYFQNHLQHQRAPRDGIEFSVRLTETLDKWGNYAEQQVDEGQGQLDVYSLAVEFGVDRPLVDWAIPVPRFGEIMETHNLIDMDEPGPTPFSPVQGGWEQQLTTHPQKIRVTEATYERLDALRSLLRCKQSLAARFCIGLSFRWYSEPVYHDNMATQYNQHTQQYIEHIRPVLERRVERARTDWGLDV